MAQGIVDKIFNEWLNDPNQPKNINSWKRYAVETLGKEQFNSKDITNKFIKYYKPEQFGNQKIIQDELRRRKALSDIEKQSFEYKGNNTGMSPQRANEIKQNLNVIYGDDQTPKPKYEMGTIEEYFEEPVDTKGNTNTLSREDRINRNRVMQQQKVNSAGAKGTIAVDPKGTARDLGQWSNRTVAEDIDIIKKATREEIDDVLRGFRKGVVNSELAKSLMSIAKNPTVAKNLPTVLKGAGIGLGALGLAVAGYDAVTGYNRVKEGWNAEGADAISRINDIQGAISPFAHAGAGLFAGGPWGGVAGGITGQLNRERQFANAENRRQQNIARQQAEDELASMGLSPNATNEEIQRKFSTRPDAEMSDTIKEFKYSDYLTPSEMAKYGVSDEPSVTQSNVNVAPQPINSNNFTAQPIQDVNNMNDNINNNNMSIPQQGNINVPQSNTNNAIPIEQAPQQPMQMTNQIPSFEQQLQEQVLNPQGAITPQDLSAKLAELYKQYTDASNNHYMYNDAPVDPRAGQYRVDPRQVELAGNYDMIAKGFGAQGGMGDIVMNNAQRLYNANMGNQAGVPYENYTKAMDDRRRNELLARASEIDKQLEIGKQQATDTATKLKYLEEQQKLRNTLDVELLKGRNSLAVQNLQNQGNLVNRQMQELGATTRTSMELPYHQTYSNAQMVNALGMINDPRQRAQVVMNSPEMQMVLFGKRINPQNANDMNALNAFIQQSYGIQMNPLTGQFAQPKGFLQSVADRIQGK